MYTIYVLFPISHSTGSLKSRMPLQITFAIAELFACLRVHSLSLWAKRKSEKTRYIHVHVWAGLSIEYSIKTAYQQLTLKKRRVQKWRLAVFYA